MGWVGGEAVFARVGSRNGVGLGDNWRSPAQVASCGGEEHSAVLLMAETKKLDANSRGDFVGADGASAGGGGLLCAGWAVSAGIDAADDGHSGAGCGGEENSGGAAKPVG